MGFDVSYHPISPEQMRNWYVASLASDAQAAAACDQAGMHELYKQKFIDYLPKFRDAPGDDVFDRTHGFFIAVTQGFFGRYHYVRGAMLSELGDLITPYTQPWSEVLPELVGSTPCQNRITQNYSSGVYIPATQVARLASDAQSDANLQAALANVFPGEHLGILLMALAEAHQLAVGLLEATDMIEPNPLDLESTHCLANLFNCDTTGPLLYQKTAQEQLGGLNLAELAANGQVERIRLEVDPATGQVTEVPPPTRTGRNGEARPSAATNEKRPGGFFSRLRGRK